MAGGDLALLLMLFSQPHPGTTAVLAMNSTPASSNALNNVVWCAR
jgi:hypothetical protein